MIAREVVEEALHRLYIGADGTSLRAEDRKKASELIGFLTEIEPLVTTTRSERPFHLVDAAAGKAYVGLLAAELFLSQRSRPTQVTLIEREARRAAACRQAAQRTRVGPSVTFTVAESAVEAEAVWPVEPDLVVALHACGAAADAILDRAVACRARHLLLVPCCTSAEVAAMPLALRAAERLGMPRHAEVRRRFIQSLVDAERTLRLEAAGYETNVVSFVPPTTTPHHLLWRARRVNEPVRRREAATRLEQLRAL
jgi:hypothetical protein